MKSEYNLGIYYFLKLLKGKWKPSIICSLGLKKTRYDKLLNHLIKVTNNKISKKVLTQQLKELISDKIVKRTDFNTVPPHVEYSLTSYGKELYKIMVSTSKSCEKLAENVSDSDNLIHIKWLYAGKNDLPIKNAK